MGDCADVKEETFTLLDILSNNKYLSEVQIWALCRECCLLLEFIKSSPDMFQSVIISPETIGLDRMGNICFLHVNGDPEPLFLPNDNARHKTTKTHIYSLGMTMLYAAKYNATNEDANAITPNLSRLVGRMTADRPSERPTFQAVLTDCDKILQDPSQDICQQIVSAAAIPITQSSKPGSDCGEQIRDSSGQFSRQCMESRLSDKGDNVYNDSCILSNDNNEGISISEVLENRVDFLQEPELWAVCREGILSMIRSTEFLPSYISLKTVLLSEQGSVQYKSISDDKSMEVIYMAPELREHYAVSEKTCVFGLGVTMHHAAGHKSTSSQLTDLGTPIQSLLLSMTHVDPQQRPTFDIVLSICDHHEETCEVPSYAICQFMFQDTATMIMENDSQISQSSPQPPPISIDDLNTSDTPYFMSSSSSAFTPLKTTNVRENVALNEAAYLPRAYTSVSTHFTPIVIQAANNNNTEYYNNNTLNVEYNNNNNTLCNESTVVKKLKCLEQKLMKSSKTPTDILQDGNPISVAEDNNSNELKSYLTTGEISSDGPDCDTGVDNVVSDGVKDDCHAVVESHDVFKKIFSDEAKLNQLHVLAETVARYLKSSNIISKQDSINDADGVNSSTNMNSMYQTSTIQTPSVESIASSEPVYCPVNLGNGSLANCSVKLQFQHNQKTGTVHLVPLEVVPLSGDGEINEYDQAEQSCDGVKNIQCCQGIENIPKVVNTSEHVTNDFKALEWVDESQSKKEILKPFSTVPADTSSLTLNSYEKFRDGLTLNANDSEADHAFRNIETIKDKGRTLQHHGSMCKTISHSSSPSPSKDSGVSGVNSLMYPTLIDRLLGSDAIKQQELLQGIVKVLQQSFGANYFSEHSTEAYNIGEYVMSLCGLKWETFTSAITEKYTQLHWSFNCLTALFQLSQKSPSADKCSSNNQEFSRIPVNHKKVCRLTQIPKPLGSSLTNLCESNAPDRECHIKGKVRSKSAVGFRNTTLTNHPYTDYSNPIIATHSHNQSDDSISVIGTTELIAVEDEEVSCVNLVNVTPHEMSNIDESFSFSLASDNLTCDGIAIEDTPFVDDLDNDEVFATELNGDLCLDRISGPVTSTAQFCNFANELPEFTRGNSENLFDVSQPASVTNQTNHVTRNKCAYDYLQRYGIFQKLRKCSNSGNSTPNEKSSVNLKYMIDGSNISPIMLTPLECDVPSMDTLTTPVGSGVSPSCCDKENSNNKYFIHLMNDSNISDMNLRESREFQKESSGADVNESHLESSGFTVPSTYTIYDTTNVENARRHHTHSLPQMDIKTDNLLESSTADIAGSDHADSELVSFSSSYLQSASDESQSSIRPNLKSRITEKPTILQPKPDTGVKTHLSNDLHHENATVDSHLSKIYHRRDSFLKSSRLSMIHLNRGNVVYHCAELKYCQMPRLKQFVQELDSQNQISLDKRKSQIDQQILMEHKMKRKMQNFYRKLCANTASGNEQKSLVNQVVKDIKELTSKLEFLELAKGHLEMLLSEHYGLNISLLYNFALLEPLSPSSNPNLEPKLDNPLLQFHISRDPSSSTDTCILHAGLPHGLMSYLYATSSLSDSYVHQFLYCFRYFITKHQLLQFIYDHYKIAARQPSTSQNVKIMRRSIDLLYFWLEGYYSIDFERDYPFIESFHDLIHDKMLPSDPSTQSLLTLLDQCQSGVNMELSFTGVLSTDESDMRIRHVNTPLSKKWESFKAVMIRKSIMSQECPSKPRIASSVDRHRNSSNSAIYFPNAIKRSASFCLTDYSVQRITEQITLLEQNLFQACHPIHFLDSKFQGYDVAMILPGPPKTPSSRRSFIKESCHPSHSLFVEPIVKSDAVERMVRHCQRLTHWVAAEILSCSTPKGQLTTLTWFVQIAFLCLQIRNFSTSMAIVDAFDNLIIRQLPCWKQLSVKCINMMSQLSSVKILLKNDAAFLVQSKDFRSKPTIPCTLIFLLHIQRVEIGGFTLVNGMFKWAKMRDITQIVDQIRMFKDRVYIYDVDASLQDLITQRINLFLDKDLHSIAIQNETNYQKVHGGLQGALRKVKVMLTSNRV